MLSACQKTALLLPAVPGGVMPSTITTETALTCRNFWMSFLGDRQLAEYNQLHLTFLSVFLQVRECIQTECIISSETQSKFNMVRSDTEATDDS